MRNILLIIFVSFSVLTCGKEKFSANKIEDSSVSNQIKKNTEIHQISNFTLIKPQVDFMFLWDNSPSSIYLNNSTREALSNTVNQISNEFDYQILMAPLIGENNNEAFFIDYDPSNTPLAHSMMVHLSEAKNKFLTFTRKGDKENGLDRVKELFEINMSNGIFRNSARHIVVLMSNGDDLAGPTPVPNYDLNEYLPPKFEALKNIRDSLSSTQFRFISIVPYSTCSGVKWGNIVYKEVSSKFYSLPYDNNAPSPTDQNGKNFPDSYDICSISDFSKLFDGINNTIKQELIPHRYNFWPIILTTDSNYMTHNDIDTSEIVVEKISQDSPPENIPKSNNDGFQYVGFKTSQNTRFFPTSGEPYTGFFIQLNGTAKVSYPDYIKISIKTRPEYYGYVHLNYRPEPTTISLSINGIKISQGGSNGWEYLGTDPTSKNIRIVSLTNLNEQFPAVIKSGWFLKVQGNAIYSNGATVIVKYFPMN
jgi:hypothetical protein